MTWEEFKAEVDKWLNEKGISQKEATIHYIDVSFPDKRTLNIDYEKDMDWLRVS